MGFPGSSDSKESGCNAGDPGSFPGLGRSPGKGNGNPLQYSCLENSMGIGAWHCRWLTSSCVSRHFPSVGKDSLEKGMVTHSSWEDPWRREWQPTPVFLPGEFHGRRSLEGYSLWGHKESDMTEQLVLSHFHWFKCTINIIIHLGQTCHISNALWSQVSPYSAA